MRLFVAVDPPGDIKSALERDVVGPLRQELPAARWTRSDGRHLTLKFLGEVDDSRVAEVAGAVRDAARRHTPFDAAFDRIGGFPNLRRPRVVWVGIGPGAEPMSALAASVEEGLEDLGFEPEGRPFRPHLTLARFKVPDRVSELPDIAVPSDTFTVRGVVLFRSQLRREGTAYTPLDELPLGE
ncbi:MAG TPA: RNA 2',3'-cyclic phosphodiesterase [Actinomycetota bacterium]|nr:RNA 2',3'-cyclic phosphodiesterase [Actinomycetota bacterium]